MFDFDANPELEELARLALAFGIGAIFGIQRGWSYRKLPSGGRVAGIRTFTLVGTFGGIAGFAGQAAGDALLVIAFAALALLFIAGYAIGAVQSVDEGSTPNANRSATTAVAALITFVLGVMATRGDMVIAASAAVVCVFVLDLRELSHGWVARIEKSELSAAIKLLVISVVVLPVLPNQGYGPGDVLNPYELWWLVVLVAGISFAGHAAIRLKGAHAGMLWTGILGGIASSTAVTVSCARIAADNTKLGVAPIVGISAATAVSIFRTLVLATLLYPPLFIHLAPPLATATVLAAAYTFWQVRRMRGGAGGKVDVPPGEPPDLTMPLQFGAFLAVFSLIAYYAKEAFGDAGVIAASGLSGLVDVDAVTVTLSRQAGGGLEIDSVVAGIVVAVVVNSLVKAAIAMTIAGKTLARPIALVAGLACAGLALGWAASGLILG